MKLLSGYAKHMKSKLKNLISDPSYEIIVRVYKTYEKIIKTKSCAPLQKITVCFTTRYTNQSAHTKMHMNTDRLHAGGGGGYPRADGIMKG